MNRLYFHFDISSVILNFFYLYSTNNRLSDVKTLVRLLGRLSKLKKSLELGNADKPIKEPNETEFDLDAHLEENYDDYYHEYEDPMDNGKCENIRKLG